MDFTETIIRNAAVHATGNSLLTYQGRSLDLSKPFARLTIVEAILQHAPHYSLVQLADETFFARRTQAPARGC